MKLIKFRRLPIQPPTVINGVRIHYWEMAFNESHLFEKLDGDMAEIIMPAKPWYVQLWRRFFPLRFVEMKATINGENDE